MSTLYDIPTPSYVLDLKRLEENGRILAGVAERTGAKILLAQKAFSNFAVYPLIGKYLAGTTASGLFEARLGREEMGKENHVYAPAYKEGDIDELVSLCDHLVFNSLSQLYRYRDRCRGISVGLRVNPEFSTQRDHPIYDPCAPGSRFGVTAEEMRDADLTGVEGLHFHTLCEQNADDLASTLRMIEETFRPLLQQVKWVNFGGGHHITREDYDIALLEECICHVQETYDVQVYLEPGEAVALNAGYLVAEVLDFTERDGITTAILDASAACHMPDVLEMPYRPPLRDSGLPGEKEYDYRLSSYTCLAGDIIGDYSFDRERKIGDKLVFEDMAIYTTVKNNTFNGIPLPSIYVMDEAGNCTLIKEFGYTDFKERLS